ncbi:microtubule-actin cross-linking factor 1-like isoform X28, partial [Dinothrombium tinctorium]
MDGQVIHILNPNEIEGLADPSLQQYECSLYREKDERDAIQKKTFTKWVNKHLIKAGKRVVDMFEDLKDGINLIALLEVLSGELLPRERGRMRVHMLQNVQMALNFLKYKKIKLVNIRAEDIVDGNPKLTLGLIWTIILHFQRLTYKVVPYLWNIVQKQCSREKDDADNIPDPGERQLATTRYAYDASDSMSKYYQSKTHMASASQESNELYRSSHSRSGLKTIHTQRVVRKTTTVTCGERKETISDIIQHDDSVTFKEALLKWAQRTTEGYPGVNVKDFTSSWRDGLAFNAIIHRNRPDLLDYRSCRTRTARENLEIAFHVAERDLGVTRLLDPEDVDTNRPDEKSLITYISSLYELFPEPPSRNPLLDDEKQQRIEEYKDACSRLLLWIRESTTRFNDRSFPNTIQEMKMVQKEHHRFRTEELPPKLHEKQRLAHAYKEAVRIAQSLDSLIHIEHELSSDNVEILWNRMLTAHQERDQAIIEEILRLEKMQRLAEKLLREIKQCDVKLDDIEMKIKEEERRVQRLNPLDAKFNCDQIEADLKIEENRIKDMFVDVQVLREGRYHKATELHNRVQQLHQRWSNIKLDFQTRVLEPLAAKRAEALRKPLTEEELIKTKSEFKFIHECIEWVQQKLKHLESLDYGHDLPSVKSRLEQQKIEHRTIDDFQTNVDKCEHRRHQFEREEAEIYSRMLNRLRKSYSELVVMSNKRLSDLETLLEFVQLASEEMKWLNEKEEVEVSRDWSAKNLDLVALESHHQQIISEMERREPHFNSVQDRGESLIRQRHPATKCIENLMAVMQSQWSWILQLINCLEIHLRHASDYHQYFNEARECDQWLSSVEKRLNTTYSKQTFTIEEGETLLREMSQLKEDISRYGQIVNELLERSKTIVPLKQRKLPLPRPMKVQSACMIKHATTTISRDETVTLYDNSTKTKWRVKTASGAEVQAPGVCFVIPPPDSEAIETGDSLKKRYEALVALWAKKQHKLRQNMIFATLKIVKSWDLKTYASMDPNQRNSIINALEEDIEKLVREGPPDDPGSKRLQEEMKALRKKFAEFEARLREEENEKSLKTLMAKFLDSATPIYDFLSEKERILKQRVNNPIPRERDSLENLVLQHKEFEIDLQSYESRVEEMKEHFHNIPKKSPNVQSKYESIIETWDRIWNLSNLYIERLKTVEVALIDIEDCTQIVSSLEIRLVALDDVPSEEVALKRVRNDVKDIQSEINKNHGLFDQLNVNSSKVRKIVEKTRPKQTSHSDVTRLEEDVKALTRRWETLQNQVSERLRGIDTCSDLLHSYRSRLDQERPWLSQMAAKMRTLMTTKESNAASRLYETLAERKPSIEDTCAAGHRFIREAKLYEMQCKTFTESLEKVHPSLDASVSRIGRRASGAEIVQQEIDNLNQEYTSLLESVRHHVLEEAFSTAEKWLSDVEDMVANQKPPSADYNMAKTQLHEQKALKNMILDRQSSMVSLESMTRDLMTNLDYSDRNQTERQLTNITNRYETLLTNAQNRLQQLEDIVPVAKQFSEKYSVLNEWLETGERKLNSMSTIPTDQERIRQRMSEHRILHQDIIGHKHDFEMLTEIAHNLMSLVGDDEAQSVVDKLSEITDRYAKLVEDSERLGTMLSESHEGLAAFVLNFEDIVSWIDEVDSRLDRLRVLSIYLDKLHQQHDELSDINDEVSSHRRQVEDVIATGHEIIKHASGSEAIQGREKLDALQAKYSDLVYRAREKLKLAQDALPIAEKFHTAHDNLNHWMDEAETMLKSSMTQSLSVQETTIQRLASEIPKCRSLLEQINHLGPQLAQVSPGQGAATIDSFLHRANRRFDAICDQIQRKAERIDALKQKNLEVINDIEELINWFRDAERQVLEAEQIRPNPEFIALLLKEQKLLCEDVNSQKSRVRDVISNAKKSMRESPSEDLAHIRDKCEELKDLSNHVSQLCADRLSTLEQALPLAEHFFEAHTDLVQWLDEVESEVEMLGTPGLNPLQIQRQQDRTRVLLQSVAEHKSLVDKLNKTGINLLKLCPESEGYKIRQILDADNKRYNDLRNILRQMQNALEEALQATSQFSDKLDGMLSALSNTADQLKNAEPIAAYPERIHEQIVDNKAIIDDLGKRSNTLETVKQAAKDVIAKAGRSDEPAIQELRKKLSRLNDLWDMVQATAKNRGKTLEEAYELAKKFWDQLNCVMKELKDLQDTLNAQEPPAVEPSALEQQQGALQEIKQEIEVTKPEVEECRKTGKNLMQICGEPDKPEVKKHIDDLDNAWETVTGLFYKREQNLIDAMEKAMNFHDMMRRVLDFLSSAEDKFASLGPIASDIEAVKVQIHQLKDFKNEVDPHMVEIESLNRQAQELMERTTPQQARAIREPIQEINRRWDDLLKRIVDRQNELENALLRLGQFQHALNEFLAWIAKTEKSLDEVKPVFGDPHVIEVELAKHKVLMNDIHAHQTSIDTLNRAGRLLIDSDRGSEDASATQRKLDNLNSRWNQLQQKAAQRQLELEELLKEAQLFYQEIQDLLMWLQDVDAQLVSSKPVGGLPETARDQLNKFMELYNEIDANRHKVESTLQQGQDYVRRSPEGSTMGLQHSLKTLKQRWENILNRANDRKIKLEIALREATEFHEAMQEFVDWLTSAEKYLSSLQPVSRVMENVVRQVEEHKAFQNDVTTHRETLLNLDKKGTHLKYFSQKQDVILIKNLLISVQHRWERLVSKTAERSRQLDHGYKEAKEFHDSWSDLMSWLTEAEKQLEAIQSIGNEPSRIKQYLSKHKEFQRSLGAKQSTYDATMKIGRALKDKAPKVDIPILQDMMDELKNKWSAVCAKSVDRQRRLEEALLFSGQFKDAIQALIDWLDKAKAHLSLDNLHGDLDTVTSLVDQHRGFQEDLQNRGKNLNSVHKTANDLLSSATAEDAALIREQISSLDSKWEEVSRLSQLKEQKLQEALRQAEKLHKSVHALLEWLSDAEMKLRFAGPLPEDEATTRQQIAEHESFMREMQQQEINKDSTIALAQEILSKCHPDAVSVIRHWITIIQSRWEEVANWAKQREQKLRDHLRSLRNILDLLEELLAWLIGAEAALLAAESEPLPDDIPSIERLIDEHQKFIDDMTKRQPDVDKVAKAFSSKRQTPQQPPTKGKDIGKKGLPPRTSTPIKGHQEPEIRNPRARELLDKWRSVWLLAMERMRRLQDKLDYLHEVDRVKNFDFDEWRRRFLSWNANKKARVMDFFRKIDSDNDGKVTQAEFIEGFLKSKFPTSRLEMEKVAPIFDRNSDGYIDHKEYLDTLRPDRDRPKTEAEIIQDVVQRLVAKCTCLHRYKVFQVGEGKYRFGESQKLRLVRILRSTVMVRVGGGWVSLDEFLLKNDPCRAKGRTNVELREQFVLAEGVSQSMTPFISKMQSNKNKMQTTVHLPTMGPITKKKPSEACLCPVHIDLAIQQVILALPKPILEVNQDQEVDLPLDVTTSGSRPGSRPSSRPPSRAASDLSTESLDGYQQRKTKTNKYNLTPTGMKRTPSFGRTTPSTNGNRE